VSPEARPQRTRTVLSALMDSSRWDRVAPRPGDIVIATAPKCGTTWMQRIVSLLVFQSAELPQPLGAVSPWIDARFLSLVIECLPLVEAQTHRRFMKTHLPLDALPFRPEARYITVARDGRDAFMSLWNHFRSFTPAAIELFQRAAVPGQPLGLLPDTEDIHEFWRGWIGDAKEPRDASTVTFFDVVHSFWEFRGIDNLLHVHYNDLKVDLDGEMRRIAAFLGIPVREDVWPELVEAATFAAMKRNGKKLLDGFELIFEGGSESFLHKGTNDRWRDVLRPDELSDYAEVVRRRCSPALARWLEHGREGGDPRWL
jgi:aryl sulfotransferase